MRRGKKGRQSDDRLHGRRPPHDAGHGARTEAREHGSREHQHGNGTGEHIEGSVLGTEEPHRGVCPDQQNGGAGSDSDGEAEWRASQGPCGEREKRARAP
ncbi:MAG: hypothetical protein ACE5ED_04660 [Rhodothalassiaceae bacterium]